MNVTPRYANWTVQVVIEMGLAAAPFVGSMENVRVSFVPDFACLPPDDTTFSQLGHVPPGTVV
ncbi:MAG: hypothetical protein WDO73_14485 [Ignavibacteriota bacterium]